MDVKGIKLTQRISKRDVNELLKDVIDIELVDDAYIGCKHKHNWRCLKCGYIFNRSFSLIKRGNYACKSCKRDIIKQKYQRIVDNIPDYELIDIYFKGDYTDNNILAKHGTLLKIKHNYCGEYLYLRCDTDTVSFYCKKCCGSYENSLAYYIEQELGEPLDKYWDFEKNTINPYHINRGSHDKIWIKCQEKDYHGSYIVACYEFSTYNQRCGYCWNFKTHPKDSFAQYHIDNTDKDFLDKYWDWKKNVISPWEISPNSGKKVWIKCQNVIYHKSYQIKASHFTDKHGCPYCFNKKVHPYDSFGYHHFDKVLNWHPDNKVSPFRVSCGSGKRIKFTCPECENEFVRVVNYASRRGIVCPSCNSLSKGELKIRDFLRYNGINHIYEKTFNNLFGIKGGNLSYDFYLPDYNLLIEFQGEQHEHFIKNIHISYDEFKRQQEHDRRKRQYAKDNNIRLLEIWYYDFDKIEEILKIEINK